MDQGPTAVLVGWARIDEFAASGRLQPNNNNDGGRRLGGGFVELAVAVVRPDRWITATQWPYHGKCGGGNDALECHATAQSKSG